jgi:hypothetical protein
MQLAARHGRRRHRLIRRDSHCLFAFRRTSSPPPPPCHRSASSGAVRGWGPPPAPAPLSPLTRSSRRSPHPRRCCSRSWRCAPPPGRRSTVPISPADASAALGPGGRAPACHTRFSVENRMHLICVPGSQFHTYDRLMSVISQDIAQNV